MSQRDASGAQQPNHTASGVMQGDNARSGAEVITLGAVGSAPDVQSVSGPNIPRTYSISVALPNGEVALIGGAETAVEFSDATAILQVGEFLLHDNSFAGPSDSVLFLRHHICVPSAPLHCLSFCAEVVFNLVAKFESAEFEFEL